jgi:hypothetical protein
LQREGAYRPRAPSTLARNTHFHPTRRTSTRCPPQATACTAFVQQRPRQFETSRSSWPDAVCMPADGRSCEAERWSGLRSSLTISTANEQAAEYGTLQVVAQGAWYKKNPQRSPTRKKAHRAVADTNDPEPSNGIRAPSAVRLHAPAQLESTVGGTDATIFCRQATRRCSCTSRDLAAARCSRFDGLQ